MKKIAIIFTSLIFLTTHFAISGCSINEPKDVPPVKIVYFIPSDTGPLQGREERLGRVMQCVQDFYRKGMELNGYGPLTFALEWDAPKKLRLYEVRGKKKQEEYGRNDAFIVRDEVSNVLKSQYGIDADKEYLVIFQLLLKRDGDISIEIGPYAGSGGSLSGTAWVYDDDRLDADLLTSKEPGGYYHGHCSLGKFNTHYIGGIAHEMGHAFGLPHVCEWDSQLPVIGNALMGSGNHTFGRDLRNEGTGTFLSETSALRLSVVRAFAGDLPGAGNQTEWDFDELTAKEERNENGKRTIVISGQVTSSPKLLGIIAYNDNMDIPSDYDAKAWMTKDISNGFFKIRIDEFISAPYQLRLAGVHENGAISQLSVDYKITNAEINFDRINAIVAEERLRRLFRNKNAEEIEVIATNPASNNVVQRMARHLVKLLTVQELVDVDKLSKNVLKTDLTNVRFLVENTGWYGVHRGMVPDDVFLRINGQFFESGLYAHAPSNYTVELGKVWETLSVGYGLQDGYDGPVRFIIRCDGKELFRSKDIKDHQLRKKIVSIKKVSKLELIVESVIQGNNGAWGIWVEPEISR